MDLSVSFHDCLDSFNILKEPTSKLSDYFDSHPTAYKIALIVNHLFRAAMMVGLMFIPYVPLPVSMAVCFVGSVFYRLTVEKNCAYKFALPAFAGAAAFMLALPGLISMINGIAFTSFATGLLACATFVPFILYGAYIILTVNYDVNEKMGLYYNIETQDDSKETTSDYVIDIVV